MDKTKEQLKALLKRDVGVEKLNTGKYIAKYCSYGMSPSLLVGDTEDEALAKLLSYLSSRNGQQTLASDRPEEGES